MEHYWLTALPPGQILTSARTYQSHFIRGKQYAHLVEGVKLMAGEAPSAFAGAYKVPPRGPASGGND